MGLADLRDEGPCNKAYSGLNKATNQKSSEDIRRFVSKGKIIFVVGLNFEEKWQEIEKKKFEIQYLVLTIMF